MGVFVRAIPFQAARSVSSAAAPALADTVLPAVSAPVGSVRAPSSPSAAAVRPRSGPSHPPDAVATKPDDLKVYWGRLLFASIILLVILVAGFTAAILDLKEWSTLLIHSFELLLGIFMGLLGGEIANRKAG